MLNFLMNDKEYEIQANMQVATILSQFDSNYIIGVVEDTIKNQFNYFDTIPKPNIVQSFEDYFKELYATYPSDKDNIDDTRNEAYHNIMDIICSKFNLNKFETENTDIFTLAFYLYDFFVSKFNFYMVNFYSKYITEEKSNIFINMGLQKASENRVDVSSNYNRYAFGDDEELAIVIANLPNVLSALRSNDIPDATVYGYSYANNPAIISLFEDHIDPAISIFSLYNNILFNQYIYPNAVTQIRLKLQMDNKNIYMNAANAAKLKENRKR